MESVPFPHLAALVDELAAAGWKERDAVRERLAAAAAAEADRVGVEEFLGGLRKGLELEVRWEIDEVLEGLQPEPEPEPEPEPDAEPEGDEEAQTDDPNRPLTAADLELVYDDPRGLQLFKSKRDDRWFATQPHPVTGQPQLYPLYPQEVTALRTQLANSPYWVLGSGGMQGG